MDIKVFLVDDHRLLREGIKQLIELDSDITVSGQASNINECLTELQNVRCDVCLLDINLPDGSGMDLIKDIKKINKDIRVLMLTIHDDVDYLLEAMDRGADGYILKDCDSAELIRAIKRVYIGDKYIQVDLIPLYNARILQRDVERERKLVLTRREKEILVNIAAGMSNKDIAEKYDITERTVKNHITNLFKKINVSDRTQAAVYAIRNNLVNV